MAGDQELPSLRASLERAAVLHHTEEGLDVRVGVNETPFKGSPSGLVERICRAFQSSNGASNNAGESMWSAFGSDSDGLIFALLTSDIDAVTAILSDPASHNQFKGFDNLSASSPARAPWFHKWLGVEAYDALIRLGEATSVSSQRL